jgi:predicted transglutaminase-like cysteine proteinase
MYRNLLVVITLTAFVASGLPSRAADTGPASVPKFQTARITFGKAALPPIGHSRFCLRYPKDCAAQPGSQARIELTARRWHELQAINREVNRDIIADPTPPDVITEQWIISPQTGNCHDYAVTKRHELLARGWPESALLLSEVVVPSGEHHLVLVVRTADADLVLDNFDDEIHSVATTRYRYQWIRIESPANPKFWSSMHVPEAIRTAEASP